MAVRLKLGTFRGEAAFSTWASKFGVGMALSTLRKRQWRDVSLDRFPAEWGPPSAIPVSTDGWQQPELAAERQEIWLAIRDVVENELTEKQRQAFSYILVHGVSAMVVAQRMGMTPGAVYKLTHDARRKLLAALERRGLSKEEIMSAFAAPG